MFRDNTSMIAVECGTSMMVWMLLQDTAALPGLHAMQLGLGPGMLTKFCHNKLGMRTTALEIDPAVVKACRDWFLLPPDGEKLEVVTGDAATEVARAQRHGTVDVLQVDLYDGDAREPCLDSIEFWTGCRACLTQTGYMTVNLYGSRESNYTPWESLERIKQVFPRAGIWLVRSENISNLIVLAGNNALPADTGSLVEHASQLEARYGLPATSWLQQLQCPI